MVRPADGKMARLRGTVARVLQRHFGPLAGATEAGMSGPLPRPQLPEAIEAQEGGTLLRRRCYARSLNHCIEGRFGPAIAIK
jgi:hypothetical protein